MITASNDTPRQSSAKPHRIRSIIKRSFKWLGIAVLALVVLGWVYQTIATEVDKRNFPPPGLLVDVDGHLMHMHCLGEGSPTVILEAGGFSFSTEWYWVQEQLASTHRVCAYDRAGIGWSAPGPAPRTAQQIVTELHNLLVKANIPGPFILAGPSS